jgi:DNA repair photolyase
LPINQNVGSCPAGIHWRYDTYRCGCGFNCAYCSEKRHLRYNPRIYEGFKSLSTWIAGHTDEILRWGVLADPFPDIENTLRRSYKSMYVLAETFHSVIITTKSLMISSGDYYDLLPYMNVILQISMVSRDHSLQWEHQAPQYRDRFAMLYKLSKRVKRLIVRCQPFMIEYIDEILDMIPAYASSGVYGVLVSGMSLPSRYGLINQWHGNGYVYPSDVLRGYLIQIKECCHENGIKFLTNEYESYDLSDGVCCGSGGLYNGYVS